MNPPYQLTKNKPNQYEYFEEFLELLPKRVLSDKACLVTVNNIKDYDLSAKNSNKQVEAPEYTNAELFKQINT